MNYLAHLALAQNNADSRIGNLLGDFRRDVDINSLSPGIYNGLQNHYLVDNTTDRHTGVISLRKLVSPSRRRYTGIIADIAFDHFLCRHWSQFMQQDFDDFSDQCYTQLSEHYSRIPSSMQPAIARMIRLDWLHAYHSMQGVERAIDRVAERIRFENKLAGGIEEVGNNIDAFEQVFLSLFPHLVTTVHNAALETRQYKRLHHSQSSGACNIPDM